MNWFPVLFCWCVCWIANRVHLLDSQAGVKTLLLHEAWLRSGELYSSRGSDATKCARTRSRNSATTSTGTGFAGDDFQNRGTFIVVRSSVFLLCSAHKAQLARDAYNALWESRRRSQERNCSLSAMRDFGIYGSSTISGLLSGSRHFIIGNSDFHQYFLQVSAKYPRLMPATPSSAPAETRSRAAVVISRLVAGISLLLFAFLTLCYAKQFDACAAVTVYPSWVWFLCGFFLVMVILKTSCKRAAVLHFCLWFLFLAVFADTPLSLVRGLGGQVETDRINAEEAQATLRVISLNCSGNKKSILALRAWKPDLILIQESPGIGNLKTVADELFGVEGNVLSGVDASIVTPGKLERIAATGNYLVGKVTLSAGAEIVVVSLRLSTPPFRFDLWNPDCWRAFRNHRIQQREELVALSKIIQDLPADMPVIVGGDFNAHPRDAIFAELPASLHDAFSSAGSGWGNTITNDMPFLRIDQIWTNAFFQPVHVYSETAVETDHRAVIADLVLK